MRPILLIAAALIALPSLANAQDQTERRRLQAQENLRNLEQTQQLNDVQRQLDNMESQRRTDQALRALQSPPRQAFNPYQTPTAVAATPPVALTPDDIARDAELAASNDRLREIAARQRSSAPKP